MKSDHERRGRMMIRPPSPDPNEVVEVKFMLPRGLRDRLFARARLQSTTMSALVVQAFDWNGGH